MFLLCGLQGHELEPNSLETRKHAMNLAALIVGTDQDRVRIEVADRCGRDRIEVPDPLAAHEFDRLCERDQLGIRNVCPPEETRRDLSCAVQNDATPTPVPRGDQLTHAGNPTTRDSGISTSLARSVDEHPKTRAGSIRARAHRAADAGTRVCTERRTSARSKDERNVGDFAFVPRPSPVRTCGSCIPAAVPAATSCGRHPNTREP